MRPDRKAFPKQIIKRKTENPAKADIADIKKGKNRENKKSPIPGLQLGNASKRGIKIPQFNCIKTIPHANPISKDAARKKDKQLQETDLPKK